MSFPHYSNTYLLFPRITCSDLASKFQEVTKPLTVTLEHRNTGSLSIISEHLNCGSRHIPLSTPHFPSPGYTDRGVSDFGVSGGPPVSSPEEEEVVTMHWKRGELVSIHFIAPKYNQVEENRALGLEGV